MLILNSSSDQSSASFNFQGFHTFSFPTFPVPSPLPAAHSPCSADSSHPLVLKHVNTSSPCNGWWSGIHALPCARALASWCIVGWWMSWVWHSISWIVLHGAVSRHRLHRGGFYDGEQQRWLHSSATSFKNGIFHKLLMCKKYKLMKDILNCRFAVIILNIIMQGI